MNYVFFYQVNKVHNLNIMLIYTQLIARAVWQPARAQLVVK